MVAGSLDRQHGPREGNNIGCDFPFIITRQRPSNSDTRVQIYTRAVSIYGRGVCGYVVYVQTRTRSNRFD